MNRFIWMGTGMLIAVIALRWQIASVGTAGLGRWY